MIARAFNIRRCAVGLLDLVSDVNIESAEREIA